MLHITIRLSKIRTFFTINACFWWPCPNCYNKQNICYFNTCTDHHYHISHISIVIFGFMKIVSYFLFSWTLSWYSHISGSWRCTPFPATHFTGHSVLYGSYLHCHLLHWDVNQVACSRVQKVLYKCLVLVGFCYCHGKYRCMDVG